MANLSLVLKERYISTVLLLFHAVTKLTTTISDSACVTNYSHLFHSITSERNITFLDCGMVDAQQLLDLVFDESDALVRLVDN